MINKLRRRSKNHPVYFEPLSKKVSMKVLLAPCETCHELVDTALPCPWCIDL